MIRIRCDACEKVFEVMDDQAEMKVACPYCGDINRVEAAGAAATTKEQGGRAVDDARASAAAAGGSANAPAHASEKTLAVVRQGMFRAHPFQYALLVLVFLGGVALATVGSVLGPWSFVAGLSLSGLAVLWWVVWWAAPHRWRKMTITNHRTILQEGIVMRTTTEVLHKQVTNVRIVQTVMDRFLSVGSIAIDTPGGFQTKVGTKQIESAKGTKDPSDAKRPKPQSEDVFVNAEIYMAKIPHPYKVKQLIDTYRMS